MSHASPHTALVPNSIHLQSCLPVGQHLLMTFQFQHFESSLPQQFAEFLDLEEVNTDSIVLDIEVILKLFVFLSGKIQLAEVVPAVVSEIENGGWFHPFPDLPQDCQVKLRSDCAKHKNQSNDVTSSPGVGNRVLYQIHDFDCNIFQLFLVHFAPYQIYRTLGEVAAEVFQVRVFLQKGENRIAHSTAQLCEDSFLYLLDLRDLPVQIGPILEKLSSVISVKLVPVLRGLFDHSLIVLRRQGDVFLEKLIGLLNLFLGESEEPDVHLGVSVLVDSVGREEEAGLDFEQLCLLNGLIVLFHYKSLIFECQLTNTTSRTTSLTGPSSSALPSRPRTYPVQSSPESKPLLNKENIIHNHQQRSSLAQTHSRKRSQVKSNSSISKERKKSVGNISERPLQSKEKCCHNHPGKSAQYVIMVQEQPLMYCQKCAVMLATQKFRVVPLAEFAAQGKQFSCRQGLTREEQVSNFLLSLESGNSEISSSIKGIQNRRCLIVSHYMQQSKSVQDYYNRVIQQVEQCRDQTLDALEMTKTKEIRLVELYQEELGDCSKQLDAIRKDITSNYQVILHNVTESSYRPIISNYFNKLNQVKSKVKEVNELPKEAVGTQNTQRLFQQFIQGKEKIQLKLRNVELGSSRGQSRAGKGNQTPFRNLFKDWGQENSPQFSR